MISLKPLTLAVAGAALVGIAGFTPASAQYSNQYSNPVSGAVSGEQSGAANGYATGGRVGAAIGGAVGTATGTISGTANMLTPQGTYPGPAYPQPAGPVQLVTNGPQANVETQSPSWSAQQNVIQSRRYDRLVETNGAFRQARMQKECGPITDPQLRQSCIASFGP
jgi:hypothetical protein